MGTPQGLEKPVELRGVSRPHPRLFWGSQEASGVDGRYSSAPPAAIFSSPNTNFKHHLPQPCCAPTRAQPSTSTGNRVHTEGGGVFPVSLEPGQHPAPWRGSPHASVVQPFGPSADPTCQPLTELTETPALQEFTASDLMVSIPADSGSTGDCRGPRAATSPLGELPSGGQHITDPSSV